MRIYSGLKRLIFGGSPSITQRSDKNDVGVLNSLAKYGAVVSIKIGREKYTVLYVSGMDRTVQACESHGLKYYYHLRDSGEIVKQFIEAKTGEMDKGETSLDKTAERLSRKEGIELKPFGFVIWLPGYYQDGAIALTSRRTIRLNDVSGLYIDFSPLKKYEETIRERIGFCHPDVAVADHGFVVGYLFNVIK
jgi:hypothetical protein